MAGYQRHDFETTSVAPGSDGGWGAFARGFSNGHSIGKAANAAINQHNVSKANEEYQKDVEAANQQDIKPQEEIDPELKKAGVSDRAAIMTKSQLEKLSPEAQEYFKGYYRDQQSQGNKPEYRYDFATRRGMLDDAASRRKEAIQSSFLRYMGPEAYNDYLKSEAEGSKASFEKFITDGKMSFAKELRDLRNNKAAMVEKAVEMGKLPRGSVFDPKSGQVLTPGKKGQMVPMPISDADINNFMDSYELQGWRRFGAGVDDFLKGQQAEVAFATKGDQIKAAKLANAKTLSDIHLNGAKSHYYGVSADEMQKNGDLGRGIKVGNFIDGTPGGKGGKTQGQDFTPLGKWDKSGVYTIDNVPFIAHTENGLAIPRLDGTGFYSEEEAGSLVDRLLAAGFDVQKINDGGQVIPVIKTLRGPVPLSYGESMLATYARVYGQPTQAIPTTSMHNYAGTGVK